MRLLIAALFLATAAGGFSAGALALIVRLDTLYLVPLLALTLGAMLLAMAAAIVLIVHHARALGAGR